MIDGSPMVTVPLDSATSISFEVPAKVTAPPKEIAVEFDPAPQTVIELFDNLALAIEPANLSFAIDPANCALVIVPAKFEVL